MPPAGSGDTNQVLKVAIQGGMSNKTEMLLRYEVQNYQRELSWAEVCSGLLAMMGLMVLQPHLSMATAMAWATPDRSSSGPQLRAFAAAREMASDAWLPPGMSAEKCRSASAIWVHCWQACSTSNLP